MTHLSCDNTDSFSAINNVTTQKCCRKIITIQNVESTNTVTNTASNSAVTPVVPASTNPSTVSGTPNPAIIPYIDNNTGAILNRILYFPMNFPETIGNNSFKFNHIQFLLMNRIVNGTGTAYADQLPDNAKIRVFIFKINMMTSPLTSTIVAKSDDTDIKRLGFTEVKLNSTVIADNTTVPVVITSPYYMAITLINSNKELQFKGSSTSSTPNSAYGGMSNLTSLDDNTTIDDFFNSYNSGNTSITIPFYVAYNINE